MKKAILAALAAFCCACSSAGPYVTNISSDGANGLNIEKCSVQFNAFMGTVSNNECNVQKIYVR